MLIPAMTLLNGTINGERKIRKIEKANELTQTENKTKTKTTTQSQTLKTP